MNVFAIKETVRQRDGFRCVQCGMTRQQHYASYSRDLEVHRVVPGSVYSVAGCVTLCRSCHGSKPKRPAGTYPRPNVRAIAVPLAMYKILEEYAKEHSGEDDEKSVSWAGRHFIRKALTDEGLWPPSGD